MCYEPLSAPQSLKQKGVEWIISCCPNNITYRSLHDLNRVIEYLMNILSRKTGINFKSYEFTENEPIGSDYIIYKYRLHLQDTRTGYCSCRIVTYLQKVILIVCTLSGIKILNTMSPPLSPSLGSYSKTSINETGMKNHIPAGQKIIPNFIIYRILGQPHIHIDDWSLKITGLVSRELDLTYNDILKMPMKKITTDFHCVTGWSVRNIEWEGVPLHYLAEKAGVSEKARWVFIKCLDGYTTIVPIEDFMDENAILALKMNKKPLTPEQGFPARILIPHLYGWKSAKWVSVIEFTKEYRDGFWEALGYHERGYVWLDERFKKC
ncbi:sulfite oxidase-like oxidoreductase [Desulfurococcaceae archaeon MEX13E-LK6-19]|nr:sulfite oxidase-like oxidoreductase [Desulfurococcaceae archaeon MEX13E-LK6-19]